MEHGPHRIARPQRANQLLLIAAMSAFACGAMDAPSRSLPVIIIAGQSNAAGRNSKIAAVGARFREAPACILYHYAVYVAKRS